MSLSEEGANIDAPPLAVNPVAEVCPGEFLLTLDSISRLPSLWLYPSIYGQTLVRYSMTDWLFYCERGPHRIVVRHDGGIKLQVQVTSNLIVVYASAFTGCNRHFMSSL